MTLYLSRMRLSKNPSARCLIDLVHPLDVRRTTDAHHKLMWSLFSDASARKRDFLWRYNGREQFFTLSHRPPQQNSLFSDFACKEFAPILSVGDRLVFTLRANMLQRTAPQNCDGAGNRARGNRFDPIYDALKKTEPEQKEQLRQSIIQNAISNWLDRQGSRAGFEPLGLERTEYNDRYVVRTQKQQKDFNIGVSDVKGSLKITDPSMFMQRYAQGFGHAKTWGCGLMLIKRA